MRTVYRGNAKIVALKLRNENTISPLIEATVLRGTTITRVTLLSTKPWCFEIIRDGEVTHGSWYPKDVPNLQLVNLFEWVVDKIG